MTALQHVSRELGLLVRRLKGMHRTVLEDVGLRVELPAIAVLTALDERGTLRPSALAEILVLDLSSISRQVAALERDGWVSRERDPADSRATLLDLTAAGREVLQRIRTTHVEHLRRRLTGWSDVELELFAEQLHRFQVDLAAADAATGPPGDPHDTGALRTHPSPNTHTTDRSPALAGREG